MIFYCNTVSGLLDSNLAWLAIRWLATSWDSPNYNSEWFSTAKRAVTSLIVLWLSWWFADWQHGKIRLSATLNCLSLQHRQWNELLDSTLAWLVIRRLATSWDSLNWNSGWFAIATQSVTSLIVLWPGWWFVDWQHREVRLIATPNDSRLQHSQWPHW